jgi:hypothetical protein|tara:strand:- start:1725 stop:3584 length:1860 start_codon:yes stop_codon:yes gene_type:complete
MAVTVSKSNNITSPDGNSLAVYKDNQTNQFTVKDIYGQTEKLFLGTGNVSGSGTTNTISLFTNGTSGIIGDSVISQTAPYIGAGTGVVDIKGTLKQSDTLNSVYIGLNVGLSVNPSSTTSQYNIGIGEQALRDFQEGILFGAETSANNVAIGLQSLTNLVSGTSNIAIGQSTLASLTDGRQNIAIGVNSLKFLDNSTALDNISIGQSAFLQLTLGERNIGVGAELMPNQTTGFRNVIIGGDIGQSASNITNFFNNVILGDNALIGSVPTRLSSGVIIGDRAGIGVSGDARRDVIIGRLAFQNNNSAGDNIAIGSNANQNTTSVGVTVQNSITIATRSTGSGTGARARDYGIAIGTYDDADAGEGGINDALGKYSVVIGGIGNASSGRSGVIIGGKGHTIDAVSENGAILGGFDNQIQSGGSSGMALGSNLIVNGNNQVVVGRFNTSNNNTKFIVGCGTSSAQRRNGFEVLNTGQLRAKQYGSSTFPATGGFKFLVAGSTGNILEVDDSAIQGTSLTVTDVVQDTGTEFFTAGTPTNAIKFGVTNAVAGNIEVKISSSFPTDRTLILITDGSFQSTQAIVITSQAGANINGNSSVSLTGAYKTIELYYDGTEYIVLNKIN